MTLLPSFMPLASHRRPVFNTVDAPAKGAFLFFWSTLL